MSVKKSKVSVKAFVSNDFTIQPLSGERIGLKVTGNMKKIVYSKSENHITIYEKWWFLKLQILLLAIFQNPWRITLKQPKPILLKPLIKKVDDSIEASFE